MTNNARKRWLESQYPFEVMECVKYLDLDKEGPNRGTKNKQDLMVRTINYTSKWKEGTYPEWKSKLATRLGIAPCTVKENYLDPLIQEGIIGRVGYKVFFVGIQERTEGEVS
jgi:hypothetical protein